MKKRNAKLQINRETLHHLAGSRLRGAAGGMDTTNNCEEASWCACASETFCGGASRWEHTCGTLCASSMAHC